MKRNFYVLSSYALAATVAIVATLIAGCEKKEEVYPVEGNAYARDPAYRAQLDAQVAERNTLAKERREINAEFAALVKRHNGDAKSVESSSEGAALLARLKANEQQFISNRMATAEITRERVKRAVADSERIKRGEAKAIDISK